MSTSSTPPSTPLCPSHQRVAVALCVRCGTFLCGECTEVLGDAAACAACLPLLRGAPWLRRGGVLTRAALLLGALLVLAGGLAVLAALL